MAKKWQETVLEQLFKSNIHFRSVFRSEQFSKQSTKSKCNFLQKNYDDFVLRMGKSAGTYDLNTISDEDVKRKIIKLKSQIGTNILEGTVYIY